MNVGGCVQAVRDTVDRLTSLTHWGLQSPCQYQACDVTLGVIGPYTAKHAMAYNKFVHAAQLMRPACNNAHATDESGKLR